MPPETSFTNRAILLTPPGAAAIAVIRITGPRVADFIRNHFSRAASPSRAVHGDLRDGETILDDAVVVLSADRCFADINLHGGAWVVASVIDLLGRDGFQILPNDPPLPLEMMDGETALEREVEAWLPLARTEQAIRVLLAQPRAWAEFLAGNPTAQIIERVLADRSLEHLLHPPRVAIVGAPNVGKSTLANQLFSQTRSITADLPGTTRDWVGESANLDGLAVLLIDTPGVRETNDPIERAAIERARDVVGWADLVIHVVDASAPPPVTVEEMIAKDRLVVLNKIDCAPPETDVSAHLATIATTGQGIDELRRSIRRFFGCEDLTSNSPRYWTDRQRELLEQGKLSDFAS